MTVPFNEIPGNLRVPLWYAEFNAGVAPYQSISRLLLIGQKLSGGAAIVDQPMQVTQNETGWFGAGSMLESMYKIARRNAPFQEIWALPVADNGAGVAASATITVGNAPPAVSGQLTVYIAGQPVRCAVTTADTNAQIATRLIAAINAHPSLPVTALVDGVSNVEIDITARHKGTLGNKIRIEIDYRGDEGPLASELLTIVAMASGAGDPDLTTKMAALGDDEFDFIAAPYADATNIGVMAAFLNGSSGRWSPIQQLYGLYFTAKEDTAANLGTFGNGLNDPHTTVMGYSKSPSPPWDWAAAYGAKAAQHLQEAPELSRPLQTLVLEGILAPKLKGDQFSKTTRQALYYDGIASYHVRRDNSVCIDRAVTTYQSNAWGAPDPSWLDVETLAQGVYVLRYLRQKVTSQWGRSALRSDNIQGLVGVATPDDVRNTIVHGYRELSRVLNVVENEALFEAALIVEINASDPNRLDIFLPIDHVNQLRIVAVNATSYLQLSGANVSLVAA